MGNLENVENNPTLSTMSLKAIKALVFQKALYYRALLSYKKFISYEVFGGSERPGCLLPGGKATCLHITDLSPRIVSLANN